MNDDVDIETLSVLQRHIVARMEEDYKPGVISPVKEISLKRKTFDQLSPEQQNELHTAYIHTVNLIIRHAELFRDDPDWWTNLIL